jgi:hypothetical protein
MPCWLSLGSVWFHGIHPFHLSCYITFIGDFIEFLHFPVNVLGLEGRFRKSFVTLGDLCPFSLLLLILVNLAIGLSIVLISSEKQNYASWVLSIVFLLSVSLISALLFPSFYLL